MENHGRLFLSLFFHIKFKQYFKILTPSLSVLDNLHLLAIIILNKF